MARLTLAPGFRFKPTDEILVVYYLKRKILGKRIASNAVAEVNIYDFCPWDLPDKSSLKSGDLEWYFFCPKSKKYSSGGRANRATETGFWKATGKDRYVEYRGRTVATIKTLVFHLGRAKDGKRTDWVLHEYRMDDKQLADAGVVQDTYVLCRIFKKSGAGPKNGAQYGAPFNEDEWDDDLVSSIDSQAVVGLVGASITTDRKQTEPEPGSSIVTISATEPTSTMNYEQKGPATTNITEPGLSNVMLSANEPTKALNYKQKGPATTDMTEPGSSNVMFSANELTKTLNCKQKGPATMNMIVPQTTHGLSVTEPGSSERPADDMSFLEVIDQMLGVPEEAVNMEEDKIRTPNEDDAILGEWEDILTADDLYTDGLKYTVDLYLNPDGPDLAEFFVG
ncbi:putative transcription factor NAM family [Helianthus annuus]|nr:putative transcription factor NAM family [Helianthus annuus]KAJ0618963.1 putative transcription factor NAM family [Helianthus annuus]KAJ0777418.1 putative transcription factor NAM family [Helianthus annuus]